MKKEGIELEFYNAFYEGLLEIILFFIVNTKRTGVNRSRYTYKSISWSILLELLIRHIGILAQYKWNNLKHLKNIHVSAHLEDGNITFLHKIEEGSIDKSYGIHVARLAGLPDNLIKRADQILNVYENKERKRDIKIQESLPLDDLVQKESPVEEELKKIDPMNTTPMDALNILYKLKEMVK